MATPRSIVEGHTVKYQLAIALNNAAVSLLEKHQYRYAVDALKASILVIQSLPSVNNDLYRGILTGTEATQPSRSPWLYLQQASGRLTLHQTLEEQESLTSTATDLFVVSSENYYDPVFLTAENLFSDSTEFAVRLNDEHRDWQTDAGNKVDIDAATIFFNYGIACRCSLDFTQCSPEEEDCLFNTSLYVLKLSRHILTEAIESISLEPSLTGLAFEHRGLDCKLSARILFQSMLTSRSLWCLTSSLSVEDVCEEYRQDTIRLSQMFVAFWIQMSFLEYATHSGASAA